VGLHGLTWQSAQAQQTELQKLRQEVKTLYDQGNFPQAIIVAKQALSVAEKSLGQEHPAVAGSLNNLAFLHVTQGQYAQAEPLYQRSLAIREKALGTEHPDVAGSLNNLAELYRKQGQYAQAEPLYKRSLVIWEKTLGTEHPDVAVSLNNLAALYDTQGQYAQAEPLYKRSLAIREKALGPEHPEVAGSLNNLAFLYFTQGQYAQAEPLYKRSLLIREKVLGPEHPDVAVSLNNLAELYRKQGRYAQAELHYHRSLRIWEKALGPEHPAVATSLNNLAALYDTQGQYAQAEPLYQRSLAIREKALGPEHPAVAGSLNNLAELYRTQGQYTQAEPLYQRSLAIWEKALGQEHPAVAGSLNNLALLYYKQGQYAQAEPLYQRSLAIREKALGPEHPDVAGSLNNLAELYDTQGQYAQAEPYLKRSLAIREKILGPEHPDVAVSLNNLAELYRTQGQYAQAEPLYKRSLAIREKTLGPEHPDVAGSLNNLAELHKHQGQYAQAEPLYQRSLAIWEKALGPDHPDVAVSLNNLAGLYYTQGQYKQAEPYLKRSLAIIEKALGPAHSAVAGSLNNLAELHKHQGQYAQAEPLYQRSLAIWEKALGPDHPDVATNLNNLADLYDTQGQYAQALSMIRRASSIYRERIVTGGTGNAAVREASKNRPGFLRHLALLSHNPGKEAADNIADEAFQIVQLEQASGTASAIAKMAARFASGDDALAGMIKRKQDASERRTKAEARLVAASSKPPQERKATFEQGLRDEISRTVQEIAAIDAELTRRYPEYQELTRPEPLSIGQIRALLKPGEAMLVYALGNSSFLWVVKPDSAVFMPLKVDVKDVSTKVATIRAEMDFDSAGNAAKVSVRVLHDLYQSIFGPAISHLAGVQHVMVVPAGPLQSLPFGMLVAMPPPEIRSNADYRQVDWLVKHYAVSVLPAVSSIQAFRQFAKAEGSQEPFAGFGDPLIGGKGDTTRGKMDVATVFRNLVVKTNAQTGTQAMEIADVEAIRGAPRLPETADELRAMAKVLRSDQKSLWLQENATETRIKHLDLSKYRTIAFATHGVMAGEIKGVGESGLILTPPRQGSIEDDGYLSAGEIAGLKLNADWVVLSACNTAAADGTPGAEGLSGLAKAFFYAGARSLLVSHWPVASKATVPLTTGMLKEYEANPGQGKSEAHRKAMMALMATPDHPEYAHPIFWAPFVVVGEGGAGAMGNSSFVGSPLKFLEDIMQRARQ
jgi:tetratricopeptide (TPR) repeat protein/CHAT domain-containing protein